MILILSLKKLSKLIYCQQKFSRLALFETFISKTVQQKLQVNHCIIK